MTAIKAFVNSHPVLSFYALAFAITWGTILIVVGLGPNAILATKDQYSTLMGFLYPMMLVGPSVAGIVLTGFLYGRAGLREMLSRLLRWRVSARWYAVALLTAPLSMVAVLLALSLRSPEFLPGILTSDQKVTLLLMGIVGGAGGGHLRGAGLDGVRHTQDETASQCPRYGALRRCSVGSVAHPRERLGSQHCFRIAPARHLPARDSLRSSGRVDACLSRADGVGLRPHGESARGDAHARKSHIQHAERCFCGDVRGGPLDLPTRLGRSAVGGCWGGRLGPRRASLAAAIATGASDLRNG